MKERQHEHFQYWGRRKDDFYIYLFVVEFRQFAQVGEGMPFPEKDGKPEEPEYRFVFTGLKCCSREVSILGRQEAERKINRILKLVENGTFIRDFSEDNYKDQIVRVYLDKDSKYWEE